MGCSLIEDSLPGWSAGVHGYRSATAAVLEALVLEPAVRRRILELNEGPTAVTEAVGRVARSYQA